MNRASRVVFTPVLQWFESGIRLRCLVPAGDITGMSNNVPNALLSEISVIEIPQNGWVDKVM